MKRPSDEPDMDDPYSELQAVFRVFQAGDVPGMSTEELASRMSSAMKRSLQPLRAGGPDVNSACLCLTLTGKLIAGLSVQSVSQDVRTFYEEVMKKVFGPEGLMAELVALLDCRDRLLSHLTAKCVSSFITCDICTRGDVDPVWAAFCAEKFRKSDPGCTLDSCLWSVTEVIKGVLREECANKQEILRKLLAGFEADLSSLYAEMLLEKSQKSEMITDLDITVSTFMDLLEALSVARLRHGISSSVQRLMFLHTPALLRLMDSSLGYFVKKRVLLLLKKTVVRRPGEDWALGEAPSALLGDEFLNGDLHALADAVLKEVAAGWLRRVSVKPQPSFFGGNKQTFPEGEGKDAVMLRATSLILIKSLQIRTQYAVTEGAEHAVNVQECLLELLAFLNEHVSHFKGEMHSCATILMVFGEQDDDIMEAAKTLTTLYLYQRRPSSLAREACAWGCNPHCHFILLLQSLSFDHTVLLDFLISAETCFLEYCVLYLKLLRDNWQDFCDSCCHIQNSQARLSAYEASLAGTSGTSQPQIVSESTNRDSTVYSRPHLVDYGSSEESEDDDKGTVLNLQTIKNPEEPVEDGESRGVEFKNARIDCTDSLVSKAVLCLAELKTVLTKLNSRGLFPYNPTSLLKLLMAVEAKANS